MSARRLGARPGALTAGHATAMDMFHEALDLTIIFKESALRQGMHFSDNGCFKLAVAMQCRAWDTNFRNRMEPRRVTVKFATEAMEVEWTAKLEQA
jgi:hypothetical protein